MLLYGAWKIPTCPKWRFEPAFSSTVQQLGSFRAEPLPSYLLPFPFLGFDKPSLIV
ncbi:hypothetical protein LguiB_016614 [Lonicera macranthoides]